MTSLAKGIGKLLSGSTRRMIVEDSNSLSHKLIDYTRLILAEVKRKMGDEKKKEKGKAEETAEKTGEAVGKGVKKGWGIAKGVGKGFVKGVKGEKEKDE